MQDGIREQPSIHLDSRAFWLVIENRYRSAAGMQSNHDSQPSHVFGPFGRFLVVVAADRPPLNSDGTASHVLADSRGDILRRSAEKLSDLIDPGAAMQQSFLVTIRRSGVIPLRY